MQTTEFETMLDRAIARNGELLADIEFLLNGTPPHEMSPARHAALDVWDGERCRPSMWCKNRADTIEYVTAYLRYKPHDRGALAIAATENICNLSDADMRHSVASCDIDELHADAMAVDEAQSEFTDWRM